MVRGVARSRSGFALTRPASPPAGLWTVAQAAQTAWRNISRRTTRRWAFCYRNVKSRYRWKSAAKDRATLENVKKLFRAEREALRRAGPRK